VPWFISLHLFAFLGTKLWGLESTVNGFRHLGRRIPKSKPRVLKPEVIWAKCQQSYRWLPFPIRCLDQALVIWYALNRAGYPAELKIGMTTTPLESHAWVVCEGKVYVDIGNLDDFHVLSTYAPWNET
jgi:hypothetical protein